MALEQLAKLVLKRHSPMMLFLIRDVLLYSVQHRSADREGRVSGLPFEVGKQVALLPQPLVGGSFQLLDPLCF